MKFYLSKELQAAIKSVTPTIASAMIRQRLTEAGLVPEHAVRVAIVEKVQNEDVKTQAWAIHPTEILVEIGD